MNLNNLTIKAQEVIQGAQEIALGFEHQAVEPQHLLKSLIEAENSSIPYLLRKIGANPDLILKVLDQNLKSLPKVSGGELFLSRDFTSALQKSSTFLKEFGDQYISPEHLLLGIAAGNDPAAKILRDNGITEKEVSEAVKQLRKGARVDSPASEQNYDSLNRFARNLNELARSGKLDPVIGRDEEIRRILQILSRRTKNNPILIGEPGVGKTAIAEGIAHRIINGDVPSNLQSKQIFSLDMGALIAGAKYKGEFEERLKSVVKEVIDSDGEIVLFIDEIHTLVGAGGGEGAMDAANILKPALSRGELRAIGATTLKEYQKYFEKDKALERRFQIVMVIEPDTVSAISILRGLKEKYENHHHIRIRDEAIIAAVELSHRYISDRFLPDKAIDLIDEAASKLRLEMNSLPEDLEIAERRIKQLEIEREAIKRDKDEVKLAEISREIADLSDHRNKLRSKWNEEKGIVDQIQKRKSGIEQLKLEAEQAERAGDYGKVAEIRYGRVRDYENEIASLQDKLHEVQGDHPLINEEIGSDEIAAIVSRWTGIPVSRMLQSEREKLLNLESELHKRVVGQDEAIAVLSDAIRRSRAGLQDAGRPVGSFIFLGTTGVGKTELAKALAEFLFNDENTLIRIDMSEYQERHSVSRLIGAPPGYVGYDESGQLTEAVRRKPYSVILLDEIEKAHQDVFNILLQVLDDGRLTDNKGRVVDFKNTIIIMTSNVGSQIIQQNNELINDRNRDEIIEKTRLEVMDLLKNSIRAEFLNRIDEIVLFKPLTKDEIRDIVNMQFGKIREMLLRNDITVELSPAAVELVMNLGYDPHYGARPVRRVIQKKLLNELSKEILAGKLHENSRIIIDAAGEKFIFKSS